MNKLFVENTRINQSIIKIDHNRHLTVLTVFTV